MDTYAAAGIPASVGYELGTNPNLTQTRTLNV